MKSLSPLLGGETLAFGNAEKIMKIDCLKTINLARHLKTASKGRAIRFKRFKTRCLARKITAAGNSIGHGVETSAFVH